MSSSGWPGEEGRPRLGEYLPSNTGAVGAESSRPISGGVLLSVLSIYATGACSVVALVSVWWIGYWALPCLLLSWLPVIVRSVVFVQGWALIPLVSRRLPAEWLNGPFGLRRGYVQELVARSSEDGSTLMLKWRERRVGRPLGSWFGYVGICNRELVLVAAIERLGEHG